MAKGEIEAIIGTIIIIFLAALTFIFRNTDNQILSWVIFIGALIGGALFFYVLITTEIKWARVLTKTFFIIPILIAVIFVISFGITMAYDASKNSFKGFQDFFYGVFVWSIIILVYSLETFLFVKINKTKNIFLKILTGIVAGSIYFVTGVIGAAIVTPPSFGTYGTPLYRPKKK